MEAVIFIGPQASGKSTFYRERFFKTHIRINLDMLRTRYREEALMQACLTTQQRFVVDNTNPLIEDRAGYIKAAKAARFRVIGYYFGSEVQACIRRNASRYGKERIPDKGIYATYRKLQIPTWDEGFDQLFEVNLASTNQFVVEEWLKDSES